MRTHRPVSLALGTFGASALVSLATLASAASIPIGGGTGRINVPVPVINPLPLCPSPSLSVCQAESGASDACAVGNHAACVTILKTEYQNEYAATPAKGAMILPSGTSVSGAGFEASGALVPYDQRRIGFQWSADATFAAQTTSAHLPLMLGRGVSTFGVTASLAPIHGDWESNGGAITSGRSRGCAEYVYEKWYDLDRFEDAAASCLDDYACVYGVGTLASTPGLAQPTLHRRDGAAMASQLASMPAVSQPKNAFFAVSPSQILSVLNQIGPGAPSDLVAGLATIGSTMPTFRYETPDRFAWHRAMHDGQASEGLGADDYRVMEERQDAYAQLVASYQQALVTLPGDVIVNAMKGRYTMTCGGTTTTGVPTTGGGAGTTDDPCTIKRSKYPFAPGSPGAWFQQLVFQMAATLLGEWSHANPVTHAVDHGCLDPSSTRCDWSPKAFARDYVGLWQKEREADYGHCTADTGDDLLVDPTYPYAPASTDLADTTRFETWLANLEATYVKDTADVPWLSTTDGTWVPDTVGNEVSGGHSIGDPSWFAADYSYDAMWQLHFGKTSDGVVCKADGEVRGKLSADVTILNDTKNVVDAYLDMTAGRSGDDSGHLTTWFKVFGADLYTPVDQTIGGSAGAWNLSTSTTMDGPHGQVTFPVLGIPVTIKGGANMTFGIDASASARAPQTCIPAQNDGTYPLLEIDGALTPYAAVDAYVSGSVDADVASIGIEATLNLITAKVPTSARLGLDFNGHDDAQVDLTAATSLELSELSGHLDAYAQVAFWSTDVQLFSWDGLHQKVPLYSFDKSYALTAMSFALRRHEGS